MTTTYNDLITQTFCENSIRSVMMIDDHFLPYSDYINVLENNKEIDDDVKDGTKRAANLMSFFHSNSFICDIDNAANHLNPEKVRKSDLLILDYHLEFDSPIKSLEILKSLRDTNHMNLAVIYTSEPLEKAWLEVASTLKGVTFSIPEGKMSDAWDELEENELESYKSLLSSKSDLSDYILTGELPNPASKRIAISPDIPKKAICLKNHIADLNLMESHNRLKSDYSELTLRGENGAVKWICIGHLFIAFCQKSDSEDDSQLIWDTLNTALHHWTPNYYRLLSSELQNVIEDGNFAMKGYLESDYESQAAWLWRLKYSNSTDSLLELYKGMNELLWDEVKSNENLSDFSKNVIDSCYTPNTKAPTVDIKEDPAAWNKFNTEALIECAEHTFNTENSNTTPKNIIHALNENLSSKPFTGKCVTVGTILYNESNDLYFLCVSPSCDTVQKQYTDAMSKSMKPDRLMKFIKLTICNTDNALSFATQSKYIFMRNNENKLALSVLNETTDLPAMFFGIVKKHDDTNLAIEDTVNILFVGDTKEISFKPVSQLKDAYAARFQAIASHHAGRIGVDYISYANTTATAVSGNINLSGHIENPDDMVVEGAIKLKTPQDLEGSLDINSDLTVKDGNNGKRPVNITGTITVNSDNKKSGEMLINSDLEVSSKQ